MIVSSTDGKSLIEKLADKQREAAKSDAEFAELLGVTRTWWNLARNGRAVLGDKALGRVVTHYL